MSGNGVKESPSFLVVPFADEHAERVAEIYNQEIDRGESAVHETFLSPEDCVQWLQGVSNGFGAFVCLDGNEVVGWAALTPFDSGSAYSLTAQLMLYVGSGYRRQGIGRQLLDNAIVHAQKTGFHGIVAFVPAVPGWRVDWLRRSGLESRGRLPAVGGVPDSDKSVDVWLLQLVWDGA
jgi:phosphinothricin acetyltransferase